MKKLILLLIGLMLSASMWAQMMDPVKWTFSVKEISADEAELVFTAKIDAGWHLYSQYTSDQGPLPIEFQFADSKDYKRIGKVTESKSHTEFDKTFGCEVKSFSGNATFRQKVKRLSDKDFTIKGTFSYQLCDNGSCLAPEDHDFSFKVNGVAAANQAANTALAASEETPAETIVAPVEENTSTEENITADENTPAEEEEKGGQSLLVIFLLALGGGILTMFTPCVFPMIPMTVNFFMRSSENKRTGRRQSWYFGFSIVLLFAVLGAVLSLIFGPEVLYLMGTHWIPNLIFFVIFFIFALSFFGLFEIKMPEKWVNGSDAQAEKGGFLGPFFIALTTVLVSFSCTGPILGAALVGLSTSTTDRWVSLVTMLGFGIGFAAPFTLLAMFPQALKNMKSGSWLNTVKVVFAFLELAFGLKFLQQADLYCGWGVLDREVYLALWIVIFGMLGFYLLGKLRFKGDDEVQQLGVGRLFLAIIDLAFVVYMIPGLWGAPLNGISGFIPPMNTQDFNIEKIVIQNANKGGFTELPVNRKYADKLEVPIGFEAFYDLDEAKAWAKKEGKPVFIDFTGKTCANCREMEQNVWTNDDVKHLLNDEFIICSLFADVNTIDLPENEWVTDDKGHVLKTLGRKNLYYQKSMFNMNAQPYYVIINADGKVLTKENYKYDRDIQKFVTWLNEGIANNRK